MESLRTRGSGVCFLTVAGFSPFAVLSRKLFLVSSEALGLAVKLGLGVGSAITFPFGPDVVRIIRPRGAVVGSALVSLLVSVALVVFAVLGTVFRSALVAFLRSLALVVLAVLRTVAVFPGGAIGSSPVVVLLSVVGVPEFVYFAVVSLWKWLKLVGRDFVGFIVAVAAVFLGVAGVVFVSGRRVFLAKGSLFFFLF